MDLAGEHFQLCPDGFLAGNFAITGISEKIRGVAGDLDAIRDEVLGVPVGFLEDLDEAEGLVVLAQDRGQGERIVGRVSGRLVDVRPDPRPKDARLPLFGDQPERLVVCLARRRMVVQPDLRQVLLALLLEKALRGLDPDGPGRGVDPVEALAEKFAVELARRQAGPGQGPELLHGVLDLAADAANGIAVGRRLRGRGHSGPSQRVLGMDAGASADLGKCIREVNSSQRGPAAASRHIHKSPATPGPAATKVITSRGGAPCPPPWYKLSAAA